MPYLYAYIALSIATMIMASVERGTRRGYTLDAYEAEDMFYPLLLGILCPITIITIIPYAIGVRGRKYLDDRKTRKEREQKRLDKEKIEQDKVLSAYMPEINKALENV